MNWIEPLIGSLGIAIAGMFTIPLVGRMWNVSMTWKQGLGMSLTFFILRFIWLAFLRNEFAGSECV